MVVIWGVLREHVQKINSVMMRIQYADIYLSVWMHVCTMHPHSALPALFLAATKQL